MPAGVLARVALRDLDRLPRLDLADGTLRGRGDDLNAGFAASADTVTELTAAGRCLTHGRRDRDEIALTFDDGPLPPYTGQILDILDSYQVKATFFCVGLLVDAYPEIVDEIRRRGHELGNHTWSHPFLPELSRAELGEQVQRTGEALAGATGTAPPTLFRPPYGGRSPQVLTGLAEMGMTTVLWDALGWDWALPGVDRIVESVSTGTGPGSVVLLHDGGGDRSQTVAALPEILDGLLARGLRFVTVDHLLATSRPAQARPAAPHPVEAR
ncbi:polysaccharide deacetylase family protein [Micromonospora sp. NPDC000207]|uniref:polysaccharide deacetylase family protein n=1 Tax=Micromonospora sp. NPDC000207 TaxID=3154246 RepID=UPI00332F2184